MHKFNASKLSSATNAPIIPATSSRQGVRCGDLEKRGKEQIAAPGPNGKRNWKPAGLYWCRRQDVVAWLRALAAAVMVLTRKSVAMTSACLLAAQTTWLPLLEFGSVRISALEAFPIVIASGAGFERVTAHRLVVHGKLRLRVIGRVTEINLDMLT